LAFSKAQHNDENISFVVAERVFRDALQNGDQANAREAGKQIHRAFCEDGATQQIVTENRRIKQLHDELYGPEPLTADMFAEEAHAALKVCQNGIFPGFQQSKLYAEAKAALAMDDKAQGKKSSRFRLSSFPSSSKEPESQDYTSSQGHTIEEIVQYDRTEYEYWLIDPGARQQFVAYAKTQYNDENISFVVAEREFRVLVETGEHTKAREAGKQIHSTFCEDGAMQQINIETRRIKQLHDELYGAAPLSGDMFAEEAHMILKVCQNSIFPGFQHTEYYAKAKARVKDVQAVNYDQSEFEFWLVDLDAREKFLAFTKAQHSDENIAFIVAEREFRNVFQNGNQAKAREAGAQIHSAYCEDGADLQINIETRRIKQLHDELYGAAPLSGDMFAEEARLILKVIQYDIFPAFQKTEYYTEAKAALDSRAKKKSFSRCSSNAELKTQIELPQYKRDLDSKLSGLQSAVRARARRMFS
jgi:hypothetical protein